MLEKRLLEFKLEFETCSVVAPAAAFEVSDSYSLTAIVGLLIVRNPSLPRCDFREIELKIITVKNIAFCIKPKFHAQVRTKFTCEENPFSISYKFKPISAWGLIYPSAYHQAFFSCFWRVYKGCSIVEK